MPFRKLEISYLMETDLRFGAISVINAKVRFGRQRRVNLDRNLLRILYAFFAYLNFGNSFRRLGLHCW